MFVDKLCRSAVEAVVFTASTAIEGRSFTYN